MEATLSTSFAGHVLVVGDVDDSLCMGMTTHCGKGVLRSACDQALAHHVTRARLPFLLPFVGKLSSRACLQDKKAMGKYLPVACLSRAIVSSQASYATFYGAVPQDLHTGHRCCGV